MQETRRNNGGMASELGHKYVIVHIKGERTKMVRALSYASREASVLKQKKKFPPRIETSKQVFSPNGVLVRATLSTTMDRDHRKFQPIRSMGEVRGPLRTTRVKENPITPLAPLILGQNIY